MFLASHSRYAESGLVFTILCGLLWAAPAHAMQPCHPPPAAELVWPGWEEGENEVPSDVVLLLRLHVPLNAVRGIWLAPTQSAGARIPLRLEAVDELGLFRASAAQKIPSGTYQVMLRAPAPRRGGPPSPASAQSAITLGPPIKVVARRIGPGAPTLPTPRVLFDKWGPKSNDMRHLRRAGRDVTLAFKAVTGRDAPAFLLVRGTYSDGKERHEVLEVAPFKKRVLIGSTGSARCATRRPILTPAPRQGTYALTVTPWSATFVKGKSVTLKGRIR